MCVLERWQDGGKITGGRLARRKYWKITGSCVKITWFLHNAAGFDQARGWCLKVTPLACGKYRDDPSFSLTLWVYENVTGMGATPSSPYPFRMFQHEADPSGPIARDTKLLNNLPRSMCSSVKFFEAESVPSSSRTWRAAMVGVGVFSSIRVVGYCSTNTRALDAGLGCCRYAPKEKWRHPLPFSTI